jgi:hypothetical protein
VQPIQWGKIMATWQENGDYPLCAPSRRLAHLDLSKETRMPLEIGQN